MRRLNFDNDNKQQASLMRWVAAGLELAERAGAAYALTDADFEAGAAENAALLGKLALLVVRKSPGLHALVRSVTFVDGEPGAANGVPLGRYGAGAALRIVVLVPAKRLDAPQPATDPNVNDAVFADGLSPPPARQMTPARFGAIHLGLCRLIERAASDIMQPFSFFAAASLHPLLGQARAATGHARQNGGATEADWSVPRPARALGNPAAKPQPAPPPGRCCICRKPVAPGADYRIFRRSKRARTRPVHSACIVRERLDRVMEEKIRAVLFDRHPGYYPRVRNGWLSLLHGGGVLRRWGGVTEDKLEAVIQELRNHADVHRVMTS